MKIEIDHNKNEVRVGSQVFKPQGLGLEDFMSRRTYNTKVKIYGPGRYRMLRCSSKVFTVPISERRRRLGEYTMQENGVVQIAEVPATSCPLPWDPEPKPKPRERDDNIRRANARIYDLFQLNEEVWTHFVTITFDPKCVDHKNAREVMGKLASWLHNQNVRKGLQYLLVPELHKNGGIHAHAIINGALKLVDSGTRLVEGFDRPIKLSTIRAKGLMSRIRAVVFNLPEWKYGFSTAVAIDKAHDGLARIGNYLMKYITKDTEKIFGKRYWFSRGLRIYPEVQLLDNPPERIPGVKPYRNAWDGNTYQYYDSMNRVMDAADREDLFRALEEEE